MRACFSRRETELVAYCVCELPFYVLLTDCLRALVQQIRHHPNLSGLRRLLGHTNGSPPAGRGPGIGLIAREAGDTISYVELLRQEPLVGSVVLHAGWKAEGQPIGAPNEGYLPVPMQLLRALVYRPEIAAWVKRPSGAWVLLDEGSAN